MGELFDYVNERYLRGKRSDTTDLLEKQKVKNAILKNCDAYIEDVDDLFTFEVLPRELQYVTAVIEEEPLKSKYMIQQISETLFVAKLQELDFEI